MTSLVVCLGAGKGTLTYVRKLIDIEPWDKIFVVTDESGLSFSASKKIDFIVVKEDQFLWEIVEAIIKQIDNKVRDADVALNFVSGSGKIHMAVVAALLKLGLGIRLVVLTPEGLKEI
ncbi:MAG: hypothetical protein EPN86_00805 [Nanoarchaeota archaeon]|nr:MAG: hypothetical protein EPN86_00805 [Nanoarchaeota archaeon]